MRLLKRSLFLAILGICLITLVIQIVSFQHINNSAVENYERSLIRTKLAETEAFAKLVSSDFYMFYSHAYETFADNIWKRLRLSINRHKGYKKRRFEHSPRAYVGVGVSKRVRLVQ